MTLKAYGVSGLILDIIKSFLSDRLIKVVLNSTFPKEYPINTGVP